MLYMFSVVKACDVYGYRAGVAHNLVQGEMGIWHNSIHEFHKSALARLLLVVQHLTKLVRHNDCGDYLRHNVYSEWNVQVAVTWSSMFSNGLLVLLVEEIPIDTVPRIKQNSSDEAKRQGSSCDAQRIW